MRPNDLMIAWAAATLMATPAQALAAVCVTAHTGGIELSGRLDSLRGGLRALILHLDTPVCLTGPERADSVPESDAVQVYSDTDAVMTQMMAMMGREVRLKGRVFAPFAPTHRAPIIMDVSEAATRP